MKRGQPTLDSRPEAASRRKPRSKIEAKLRLRRRGKFDERREDIAKKSPRTTHGRKYPAASSGSDSDERLRCFTSKQRVELADFEPERRRRAPLPRMRKLMRDSATLGEKFPESDFQAKNGGNGTRKTQSDTAFAKKATNPVRRSWTNAQLCGKEEPRIFDEYVKKCREKHRQDSRPSIDRTELTKCSMNFFKKRSRSAPCTPLFRIKCPKEKCPRNVLAEGKYLLEKSVRLDNCRLGKNRCIGRRVSRSGCQAIVDSSEEKIGEKIGSFEASETLGKKSKPVSIEKKCSRNFLGEGKSRLEKSVDSSEEKIGNKIGSYEVTQLEKKSQPASIEIECLKEKCLRNFFSEEKALLEKSVREENRRLRKNRSNGPAVSRSDGRVARSRESTEHEEKRTTSCNNLAKVETDYRDDFRETKIAVEKAKCEENLTQEKRRLEENVVERQTTADDIANAETDNNDDSRKKIGVEKKKSEEKSREEIISTLEAREESTANRENRRVAEAENFENKIATEKPKLEENRKLEENAQERGTTSGDNFPNAENVERKVTSEKSPRKPPKKRAFKWETILEKQHHRSSIAPSPENRKTSPEKGESHFRADGSAAECSRFCRCPRSCGKSVENRRSDAHDRVKEELAKIFAKRRENATIAYRSHDSRFNESRKSSPENFPTNYESRFDRRTYRFFTDLRDRRRNSPRGDSVGISSHATSKNPTRRSIGIEKSKPIALTTIVSPDKSAGNNGGNGKMPGASILKRRKTPSPRRVTFRLPGRSTDENRQENVDDFHGDEVDLDWSKIPEENSRFSAGEERNCWQSDHSEQDWETPCDEDAFRGSRDVRFPRETREAMTILLRAKCPNTFRHHCQRRINDRKIFHQHSPYSPDGNSTIRVSKSYAKALAKFQERCDLEFRENFVVAAPRLRGSPRTANEAAAEIESSSSEWKTSGRKSVARYFHDSRAENNSRNLREVAGCRPNERTMQSNGSEVGNSENGIDRTGWTVGLINGKFKYLTAETFGFKINANGASLKKKQLWTLEGSEHQVFLRSHLDRYLAVDQFGNVTCEAEDSSDPGCAFQIQLASDGSGRWALKNVQRGYFLGSSQDELKCMAKAPGEAEYWLVHLAARPQVNLRSAGRKRFAHLSASQDEIHVDAPVPWGEDTLFTLEFRAAATADNETGPGHGKAEGGHYALHTCNNKYLARDGKLLDSCTRECLYAAEFHAGLLALRDVHGAYLAPIGSKAVLKSRSTTVTRDELFSLEESLPQASFVAALNQRYVSVKQGVDVTANQDEISGHETFQLEFDRVTKRWYVRTMQDRYWSLEAGGGIQASDHKRSSNALFDLVWQPEDGTVALRANNGKFLATKRSGHLYANADSPDSDSDASKYYFYLMNRPILVLRCEQGFVGPKSAASPKLECNKAGYETIRVERCERGVVRFKGQNGLYWHADSEGVTVDSEMPAEGFYLELREPSRLCIKCTDGRYLTAGKNGALRLGETAHDSATKWEF